MEIFYCEQRSEAWYQARCGRITASSFADLMATETTAAYQNLVSNTAAEIVTGRVVGNGDYTSQEMQHGIDTEPEARKAYEEIFGIQVEQVGLVIPDEGHKFYDYIGESPDGLMLFDKGQLEIKCPKESTHMRYIKNGVLPSTYKFQVQGQLYVSGLNYIDFMSYVPGMKPFLIRVEPDLKIFKAIEERLEKTISLIHEEINSYLKYELIV